MIIKGQILNSILFGVLTPWKKHRITDAQFREVLNNKVRDHRNNPVLFFKSLITALNEISISLEIEHIPSDETIANLANFADLQTKFEILAIPDFYDKSSEFYHYLLINERYRILGALETKVQEQVNYTTKSYQVLMLLRKLNFYIQQIAKKDHSDKLCDYVSNTLTVSILYVYEVIRVQYSDLLENEALTINEIINLILPDFNNNKTNPSTIDFIINQYKEQQKSTQKITTQKTIEQTIKVDPEKPIFVSKNNDFRKGYTGKLSYEDIINPDLFSRFEQHLYENDFINLDYDFTDIHKKKRELAILYRILIVKKFFSIKNRFHRHDFKPYEYRQYLDNRYNVDTSQQFKKADNEKDKQAMINKYIWIDRLPTC